MVVAVRTLTEASMPLTRRWTPLLWSCLLVVPIWPSCCCSSPWFVVPCCWTRPSLCGSPCFLLAVHGSPSHAGTFVSSKPLPILNEIAQLYIPPAQLYAADHCQLTCQSKARVVRQHTHHRLQPGSRVNRLFPHAALFKTLQPRANKRWWTVRWMSLSLKSRNDAFCPLTTAANPIGQLRLNRRPRTITQQHPTNSC